MAGKKLYSEPMSNVDAAWLHMDVPANMAVIVGVMMFDGRLDFERLQAIIMERLLCYDRFKMRVVEPRLPVQNPRWEIDANFQLDAHLRKAALPAPGDDQALKDLVGEISSIPLDRARPLWQMHYVENYYDGCALIVRLHHCIADGLALVQVLLSMADDSPNSSLPKSADQQMHEQQDSSLLGKLLYPPLRLASRGLDLADAVLRQGLAIVDRPSRVLDAAKLGLSGTKALAKLLLIGPDTRTMLRGKCGISKRTAWTQPIPLDHIKTIGREMGGTVNDVLVSAVAGGLRRYLKQHRQKVGGVNIRAVVPVNIRPAEDLHLLGNRFGLVFLSLPVGLANPTKRLQIVRSRMDAIKDTPEAVVAFGILQTIGMTPTQIEHIIVDIFGMKASAVLTNVPGPRKPLYLVGEAIKKVMFWVPQPGGIGLGISIISYAGDVLIGVASDAGLIPDPDRMVASIESEFTTLYEQALAAADEQPDR